MIEEEKKLISQVKSVFYSYKLLECINLVDKINQNRSIVCSQYLGLYKGISLCETQQLKEGFQWFEEIIQKGREQKGERVDSIDVILRIYYQLETFYCDQTKAIDQNDQLIQITENYKKQNEHSPSYDKGIYLFGKGFYTFLQNYKKSSINKFSNYLEDAYTLIQEDFKQEFLIILGWLYYLNQQYDLAVKYYQILYDINPKYSSLSNNFALVLKAQKQTERAEKLFLEAEESCSFNQVILLNIAYFYQSIGNLAKEKEYMDKLILLNPKSAKACHNYGTYLYQNGDQENGLKYLNMSIQIYPNYKNVYYDLVDTDISPRVTLVL